MAHSKSKDETYRILMVTSEAVPFAKTGGLADAVSALARELDQAGHDVRLIMPRYYSIQRDRLYRHPTPLEIPVAEHRYATALYEGRLPDSEVTVYFLDYELLYGRQGIYGSDGTPYGDNLERFTLLAHAACALGPFLGWEAQIVHSHDWSAALTPLVFRQSQSRRPAMFRSDPSPAQVLTIHNIGYQGIFPVEQFPQTGLPWESLAESGLLHYNELNMLKAGITHADKVTTVSETYAREIRTPTYGFTLDDVINVHAEKLSGITNGVDYSRWNPERDPHVEVNYTAETVALKQRAKTSLQVELGLPRVEAPLVGMVTRLVDQKGLDELAAPGYGALPAILDTLPLQMVVLGTGEARYEYHLRQLARRFSNLKVIITFSEPLAHRIVAASDFLLMPSRYEPCGLTQLYSLRYGTLPIVTRSGGFADTVQEISEDGGSGIFIDQPCPTAIVAAVTQAVSLWREEPTRITAMRRRAMKERFTWEAAVESYLRVYAEARTNSASA